MEKFLAKNKNYAVNTNAINIMTENLKNKGYKVFWGNVTSRGIPTRLLIGAEQGKSGVKDNFTKIACSAGIRWFESGNGYFEV